MPNRIIKESICTSDNLNNLTAEEEVFFYRLTVNCDDYGRLDARPQILRAKCFPLKLDKIKESHIENWLLSLIGNDLIILYRVNDREYLQLTTWTEHQQVRAKKSKFPGPDDDGAQLITFDSICDQEPANVPVSVSVSVSVSENDIRESISDKRDAGCGMRAPTPTKKPKTKNQYAENVTMTEQEYQKLVDTHGQEDTDRMIDILNNFKASNGKKYKSDYHAILNWVVERLQEEKQRHSKYSTGPPGSVLLGPASVDEWVKEKEAQNRDA